MPSRYTPLLQYLRRLACPSPACTAPDAELLRRFVHHHDVAVPSSRRRAKEGDVRSVQEGCQNETSGA